MNSQTRQEDKSKLIKKLKELNPNDRSERQLSLFNEIFSLIELKKKDTDTTASGMRDKLVEALNDNTFQIQPNNISQALKKFDEYDKDNVTTSTTPNQPSGQTFVPGLKKTQGATLKQVTIENTKRDATLKQVTIENTKRDATLKRVTIEDTILSNSDTDIYIIIDAIPLSARKSSNPLNPTYDLESTDIFFCFKDPNVKQQYEDRINNYKTILEQLEKEKDKAKTEAELKPLLKEIEEVNQEILNTYAAAKIAAYSGYKITRKNGWGKLTNQSAEAKDIEITTKLLGKKDALRIRLRSGGFLEIHLDENGNYDHTRPPIPLTAAGKEQPRLFSDLDADTRLIDNNYERTLEDLKFLDNFTINGEQVLPNIIESIEQKYAKQIMQQNPDLQDEFLDSEEPVEKQGNFTQKEIERTQSQSIDNSNLLV